MDDFINFESFEGSSARHGAPFPNIASPSSSHPLPDGNNVPPNNVNINPNDNIDLFKLVGEHMDMNIDGTDTPVIGDSGQFNSFVPHPDIGINNNFANDNANFNNNDNIHNLGYNANNSNNHIINNNNNSNSSNNNNFQNFNFDINGLENFGADYGFGNLDVNTLNNTLGDVGGNVTANVETPDTTVNFIQSNNGDTNNNSNTQKINNSTANSNNNNTDNNAGITISYHRNSIGNANNLSDMLNNQYFSPNVRNQSLKLSSAAAIPTNLHENNIPRNIGGPTSMNINNSFSNNNNNALSPPPVQNGYFGTNIPRNRVPLSPSSYSESFDQYGSLNSPAATAISIGNGPSSVNTSNVGGGNSLTPMIRSPSNNVHSLPKQPLSKEEKLRRRREFHNAVERKRRDHIKDRIKDLSKLVPPLMLLYDENGKEIKPNKATTLSKTVDYVNSLHTVIERQVQRREAIIQKINELKKLDVNLLQDPNFLNSFSSQINSLGNESQANNNGNDNSNGNNSGFAYAQ